MSEQDESRDLVKETQSQCVTQSPGTIGSFVEQKENVIEPEMSEPVFEGLTLNEIDNYDELVLNLLREDDTAPTTSELEYLAAQSANTSEFIRKLSKFIRSGGK